MVSPEFIPPEDWLRPIVGEGIAWAPEGSIEEVVRDTIFQRYSQIGATLSGGPTRYAPIFMRTDDGEVLLEDFANGFYLGMRLSLDDWKPHMSNPAIGYPLTAILGHCTTMLPEDQRQDVLRGEAGSILAESWKVVPEIIEMLHISYQHFLILTHAWDSQIDKSMIR